MYSISLKDRIESVVEHYDETIVVKNKHDVDNVVSTSYPVSLTTLYRHLVIVYGDRVKKSRKGIHVRQKLPVQLPVARR